VIKTYKKLIKELNNLKTAELGQIAKK